MYNIDKLEALKEEFISEEELLGKAKLVGVDISNKDIISNYDIITSQFINFIKEKENPFNPDQTILKFEENEDNSK